MAGARKVARRRPKKGTQSEATNEPLSGASRRARKTMKRPAQRKSAVKKPSKAPQKAPRRAAVKNPGSRRKGTVARPGVNPRPGGRGKRR